MRFRAALTATAFLAAAALWAQQSTFEGAPAIPFGNDKLQLQILPQGSSIAGIVLSDDPRKISPLWNPARMQRESGEKVTADSGTGHFLCLDGFGPVSPEEQAAGLPFHGEAHLAQWKTLYSEKRGANAVMTLATTLPIVQENVQRTYRMVDGEQVLYVETQVESLLGFDRPLIWAEHATAGSPFLAPGVTLIEMSATKSRTRPYVKHPGDLPDRFQSNQDFSWPWAPGLDGKRVDMRLTPARPNSGGHTTSLMDRKRKLAFLTFFNPQMGLLLGYLFKPEEFPWVQSWENSPPTGKLARGLEFSTQPYDVPRREAIQTNSMFDTPTYRWLPARSKTGSRFLMFLTRTPQGFRKVDDVRMEGSSVVVEDKESKRQIKLAASLPL
jgi:hypothetical protein